MKAIIAIFCFIASLSQAQALVCTDVEAGPDNGYMLKFSKSMKTVKVSEQTIAGPHNLAKLTCKEIPLFNMGTAEIFGRKECKVPGLFDAGYFLVLETGGFTGVTTGYLSQISIGGGEQLATFNCH